LLELHRALQKRHGQRILTRRGITLTEVRGQLADLLVIADLLRQGEPTLAMIDRGLLLAERIADPRAHLRHIGAPVHVTQLFRQPRCPL
jgi:hypothetical protein